MLPSDFNGKHSLLVLIYSLEHVEQSPLESQSVHPVLLPLGPQQLPPRHTPLEQSSLLEEHVPPSDFLEAEQLPPDRVYPELHPSQDPEDEQSLQLLSYTLQQRLPCAQKTNRNREEAREGLG